MKQLLQGTLLSAADKRISFIIILIKVRYIINAWLTFYVNLE